MTTQHHARPVLSASLHLVESALLDFAPFVLLGVQIGTLMGRRPASTANPDSTEMRRPQKALVIHAHSDGRLQLLELPVKTCVMHVRMESLRRMVRHLARSALPGVLTKIWTHRLTARSVQTERSQAAERRYAVRARLGRWTATPTQRRRAPTAMPVDLGMLGTWDSLFRQLANVALWEKQTWMATVSHRAPTVQ